MGMGRLPVAEALRISLHLADTLRQMHDLGHVCGQLTPEAIDLTDTGLHIRPAPDGAAGAITAYTAPEVIDGQAPDAQADIFAFGAILSELVAGHPAIDAECDTTPPLGIVALDKIVNACMVKDPATRVPRIQRVMLELKLAAVAARKAEASETLRREIAKGATRDNLQELEARLEARLMAQTEAHELAIEELRRAHNDSGEAHRDELALLCSELVATQERLAAVTAVPIDQRINDLISGRLLEVTSALKTLGQTTEALKRTMDEITRRSQQFEQRVTAELLDLSRNVKSNALAIEAGQKSQAQNEDLIEQVIETLESLHGDVLEPEAPAEGETALSLV
jgi:hypothetical protein